MSPASRVTRGSVASAEDFASLSTRERLIFAQAVYEYGAKQSTWPEIAKLLSKHPLISRPKNFFTLQSCMSIYSYLMDQAGLTPSEAAAGRKAQEHLQLAQLYYRERTVSVKDEIVAAEQRFKVLVQEIEDIKSGKWDDRITAKLQGKDVVSTVDQPEGPHNPRDMDRKADAGEEKATEDKLQDQKEPEHEIPMDISSPAGRSPSDDAELSVPAVVEKPNEEAGKPADNAISLDEDLTGMAAGEQAPASPQHADDSASAKSPAETEEDQDQSEEPNAQVEGPQIEKADTDDAETAAQQSENEEREPILGEGEEESTDAASHESTPAPPTRGFKRRASEVEGTVSDVIRDRKKVREREREESEPVELDDADSPATPSAAPSGLRSTKERSRFQRVIYMLHAQISAHRNGTIFHHPIKPSDAPDYRDIVKRPMDLKTIKNRVRDGRIAASREYQRDIYLMFANSLMYNRPNSDIYVMAEEMMLDSEAHINNFQQTEVFNEARTRT